MRAVLAGIAAMAGVYAAPAAGQAPLVCAFNHGGLAGQVMPVASGAVGDACSRGASNGYVHDAREFSAAAPVAEPGEPVNPRSAAAIYGGRPPPKCAFDDGTSGPFAGPSYPAPGSWCSRLKLDRTGKPVLDAAGKPIRVFGKVY